MNKNDLTFIREDFSRQNLEGATFTQCRFYNCNFDNANLRDSKFVDCSFIDMQRDTIEGCSFRYSQLQDASFSNCMLAMSLFKGANCLGIEFRNCDMKGVSFQGASFANRINHQMFFCSAFITGCNLSYANFERVLLEKCDLFENRWNEANLSGASFRGSDLSRGEFTPEQWGTFAVEQCDLTHVELEGLNISRVSMDGVKICDWQQEQLLSRFGIIVI